MQIATLEEVIQWTGYPADMPLADLQNVITLRKNEAQENLQFETCIDGQHHLNDKIENFDQCLKVIAREIVKGDFNALWEALGEAISGKHPNQAARAYEKILQVAWEHPAVDFTEELLDLGAELQDTFPQANLVELAHEELARKATSEHREDILELLAKLRSQGIPLPLQPIRPPVETPWQSPLESPHAVVPAKVLPPPQLPAFPFVPKEVSAPLVKVSIPRENGLKAILDQAQQAAQDADVNAIRQLLLQYPGNKDLTNFLIAAQNHARPRESILPKFRLSIGITYKNTASNLIIENIPAIIGRPDGAKIPEIDLTPDLTVSRNHARLFVEKGDVFIEDLKSKFGSVVNGVTIQGRVRLQPEDVVRIGETTLVITLQVVEPQQTDWADPSTQFTIEQELDAKSSAPLLLESTSREYQRRLEMLFTLPTQFATQASLDELLQLIIERVVEMIPGASHGTLLLLDQRTNKLVLKAYVSDTEPWISDTLARRAMDQCHGFIWRRNEQTELSETLRQQPIETGMYVPLLWNQKALGIIAVDNAQNKTAFNEHDLRFMLVVANFAAMAVANHQLQDELGLNNKILERLLANFSPKIRKSLIDRAQKGRLRPGGEKSEVTLLLADLRDFTRKVATLDTEDVMELLHDYYSVMVEAVFKYDGTVDKFIGDAVLAIFGSPEADPHHHEKAIRAALSMQKSAKSLNAQRKVRGDVVCEVGIGLHCGEVLHGFIGTMDRLEFTVIGDAVNRTSRFCDAAKGGEIIISPAVYQRVFKLVQAGKQPITTKHGETLESYLVKSLRDRPEPA